MKSASIFIEQRINSIGEDEILSSLQESDDIAVELCETVIKGISENAQYKTEWDLLKHLAFLQPDFIQEELLNDIMGVDVLHIGYLTSKYCGNCRIRKRKRSSNS